MSKLSPGAQDALTAALCTRGKNKGRLLKAAPPSSTLAYAAWQGAMLSVNPYKVSVAGFACFMTSEQRTLAKEISAYFDAMPKAERIAYDADRLTLERCGVW